MSIQPLMLIGEFSKRTGLPRDTIRFYERRGLLRPTLLPNNYRGFDEHCVERAIAIRVAQSLGFSLLEIGHTISQWQKHGLTTQSRLQFLNNKLIEIDARIAELAVVRRYLQRKKRWTLAGEKGIPPELIARLPLRKRLTR
jgi:MerR family transcriptional regulator, copper efflux regulator